jgi:serine/threonine protein kinase
LLEISAGEHLKEDQRRLTEAGSTKIKSKFLLHDVLRKNQYGAVYLYQQKEKITYLSLKKSSTTDFEASNLLASLQHKNIVNTLTTSRNDNFFILRQEDLSDRVLQDQLASQLSQQDTLNIAKQACEAMVFAHNNRIFYGHLRPTSILFTPEGKVKVTDFSLLDDITDIKTVRYFYQDRESRSIEGDIYAIGGHSLQLFTGGLPRRRNKTGFVVRKYFAKLLSDIQKRITSILPTIPENCHSDSFQKSVAIFDHHTQRRRFKLFNEKPSILKNLQSDRRKGDRGAKISGSASILIVVNNSTTKKLITGRVGLLFILLVLIYCQYHFVLSGQEKITQKHAVFLHPNASQSQRNDRTCQCQRKHSK